MSNLKPYFHYAHVMNQTAMMVVHVGYVLTQIPSREQSSVILPAQSIAMETEYRMKRIQQPPVERLDMTAMVGEHLHQEVLVVAVTCLELTVLYLLLAIFVLLS
jgi:hypothetical protein